MLSSLLSLLPLALLASLAEAANHVVTVGKGGQLAFDPPNLTAAAGDTVTYQFFAKNHSVVQASFAAPCHPLDGGFFSGFTPSDSQDVASTTTFTITVNDTSKPLWAYCSQTNGNHCQQGMVHSINAPSSGNTLDAFKQAAAGTGTSTSPASPNPAGGKRIKAVIVGVDGKLEFSPPSFQELPGTYVQFSYNPKNHSVVQSSFEDPCHPLSNGFSSGFVPTTASPSGAIFEIVVPDTKPIWFYCAQTTGNHCQSGMVGAINAATSGDKTIDSFKALAAKASGSTIPPDAPLYGTFTFNGQVVSSFHGAVFTGASSSDGSGSGNYTLGGNAPKPGENTTSTDWGMAGGSQPMNYNWGSQISDNATNALYLLEWLDNILLEVLYDGYGKLNDGAWKGTYPKSIVNTIGSMAAQALVHRSTSTDSLRHYGKTIMDKCQYNLPTSVDAFLSAVLALLLLEIGVLIDVSSLVAVADPWLVPALTTQVGAKARMTAVVNMMQNHLAASAVREVMIPMELAYSYAANTWVGQCPGKLNGVPDKPYPPLTVTTTTKGSDGRVNQITIQTTGSQGSQWIAWIGPWGSLQYTQVDSSANAKVPDGLYGHVWVVLVSKNDGKLQDVASATIAGPQMVWIGQP
ncbi:hypothetical protein GQ53DRAFT_741189 [Thozetella sp. PMI_491]|nr:hypothetical protein GQ53DRAFT_741189 [Thozetella sp. PMI_491]